MTAPITLPQIYRAAADLLEAKGWTQGENVGPHNEHCLGAAINIAAGRSMSRESPDLFRPLALWLIGNRRDDVVSGFIRLGYDITRPDGLFERAMAGDFDVVSPLAFVQRYNDTRAKEATEEPITVGDLPARTREEVLAALRECAEAVTV